MELKSEKKLSSSSANSEIIITQNNNQSVEECINTYCIDYVLSLQEDMYLSSLECQQENFDDKL